MLLNMWMITNQLAVLEPELHLLEEEELEIRGIRLYSTDSGYLYIYQQENDCVCSYKKEYFILANVNLEIAFGILQEIFEFYEEWENNMLEWVQIRDFQKIADSCNSVLNNPMVILDDNYKVLGMSSQYKSDEADEEWRYLSENGYSSIKAVRELHQRNIMEKYGSLEDRNTIRRVKLEQFGFVNICKFIRYNHILCGRLVVLEKNRLFSRGDVYFLQKIADITAPYIQISDAADSSYTGNSIFNLLLDEKNFDEDVLSMQIKYFDWEERDEYYLLLIDFKGDDKNKMALQLMRIAFLKYARECYTLVHHGRIVVIGNGSKCRMGELVDKIKDIVIRNEAECFGSLELEDIHRIPYLYRQIDTYCTKLPEHKKHIYFFREYAVDYILSSCDKKEKLYACAPEIRKYYESNGIDNYLEVVKTYLLTHESLVHTAKKLYIHRNTMIYRLTKATELMNLDLSSGENCFYYLLSIRLLENLEN